MNSKLRTKEQMEILERMPKEVPKVQEIQDDVVIYFPDDNSIMGKEDLFLISELNSANVKLVSKGERWGIIFTEEDLEEEDDLLIKKLDYAIKTAGVNLTADQFYSEPWYGSMKKD